MSQQPSPVPEQPPAGKRGLRRTASAVGGGLGCLVLLVVTPLVAVMALAIVVDDLTWWIAVAALVVAVAAYRASTRGR